MTLPRALTYATLAAFTAITVLSHGHAVSVSAQQKPANTSETKAVEKPNTWVSLKEQSPIEAKVHAAKSNAVDVEFVDVPMKDAMSFLADAHQITIIVDEAGLAEEGIAPDEPVNTILSGVTLESALGIMLRPLGLTYVVENEVMMITTEVKAEERRDLRVYDVRALEQDGTTSEKLADLIRKTIHRNQWAGSRPAVRRVELDKNLYLLLYGDDGIVGVHPFASKQTYFDRNPSDHAIETLPGKLVVTTNPLVHRKIADLLTQLSRGR